MTQEQLEQEAAAATSERFKYVTGDERTIQMGRDYYSEGYITCASRYIDELVKLRAENERLKAAPMSKDFAMKILLSAAALINEKRDEAYHQLYAIADASFMYMGNPWQDLETIAGTTLHELAKATIESKITEP